MIKNDLDWYCQLFIDAPLDTDSLRNLIVEFTNGQPVAGSFVENKFLEINVRKSHDWDESKKNDPYKGFLFYKFFLDIVPKTDDIKFEDYVQQIKSLMAGLRAKGFKVVPACDYEDLLLNK